MQITRASVDTQKGPADWFTGDVYIDAVAVPAGSSTFAAASVRFTPGAPAPPGTRTRTARPSSSPKAWACASARAGRSRRSGPATACSSSPASTTGTARRFMVHIAMHQNDETGSPVTWGEHVTDEQHGAGRSA